MMKAASPMLVDDRDPTGKMMLGGVVQALAMDGTAWEEEEDRSVRVEEAEGRTVRVEEEDCTARVDHLVLLVEKLGLDSNSDEMRLSRSHIPGSRTECSAPPRHFPHLRYGSSITSCLHHSLHDMK
mmetsp:Transcript_32828/g.81734  ORF Transcript_32828/g.81734 Transcript_32828/m.81734 type:complete len:126 (+) Transcript_32828:744-1121(+)